MIQTPADARVWLQVDAELSKEMEQWNETFRTEVIRLCQENYFNTGFFEGGDGNLVVDAYELKVATSIDRSISPCAFSLSTEKIKWVSTLAGQAGTHS